MRSPALLLALALAAGCHYVPRPGYIEVSPYYGEGLLQRSGSPNRAVSEHYGMMVTLGFQLDDKNEKKAWDNLARLEVDRMGRLALDDPDPVVVVPAPAGGSEGDTEPSGGFPWNEVVAAVGALTLTFLTWLRMRVGGDSSEEGAD